MPLPKAKSIFDAVTQRGSVSRQGDVTILRMDGAGAIAAPTLLFQSVARWAMSRQPSGILQKDRSAFLERFEIMFAKPGSMVQTRGSAKPLYDFLMSMERIGIDIHEWDIPHGVLELIQEAAAEPEPEEKPAEVAEEESEVPA